MSKWEEWEDDLIREHYPEHGAKWYEGPRTGWRYLLADRTPPAIMKRAQVLGVRYEPSKDRMCCKRCGKSKPLDMFKEDGRFASGRNPMCRPCAAADARRRRQERYEREMSA